jgi:hypothetical protein
MSAVTARVKSDMDHSCNWKCCFGCLNPIKEPEIEAPPTIIPYPLTPRPSHSIHSLDSRMNKIFTEIKEEYFVESIKITGDIVKISPRIRPISNVEVLHE